MLRVPVDEVEILDGPGKNILTRAAGMTVDNGLKVRFTCKSRASYYKFVLKGVLFDVVDTRLLFDAGEEDYVVNFYVHGVVYSGHYTPHSREKGHMSVNCFDLNY